MGREASAPRREGILLPFPGVEQVKANAGATKARNALENLGEDCDRPKT